MLLLFAIVSCFLMFTIKASDLDEVPLDAASIADIRSMYHGTSEAVTARDTFLSMCLCGPFKFSIPKLG